MGKRSEAAPTDSREIREEQRVVQKNSPTGYPRPAISALESGDLDRSGLATLRAYVEALGGPRGA